MRVRERERASEGERARERERESQNLIKLNVDYTSAADLRRCNDTDPPSRLIARNLKARDRIFRRSNRDTTMIDHRSELSRIRIDERRPRRGDLREAVRQAARKRTRTNERERRRAYETNFIDIFNTPAYTQILYKNFKCKHTALAAIPRPSGVSRSYRFSSIEITLH